MYKRPVIECRSTSGKVDVDIIPLFQKPAKGDKNVVIPPKGPYFNLVDKLKRSGAVTGEPKTTLFVRFSGKGQADSVLFSGIGPSGELVEERTRIAGAVVFTKLSSEKSRSATVSLEALGGDMKLAQAFTEGFLLASYRFDKHRSQKKDDHGPHKLVFTAKRKETVKELATALAKSEAAQDAVTITRDWSNEPSNYGTPIYYAEEAQKIAKAHGLTCKILGPKDFEHEKMGMFIGVGQGSKREGRIVVVEYHPKGHEKAKTLALVGKGITFDSGGLSLKPPAGMEDMKHDMTGAATVFGATLLAAKWGSPNRIICVMGFTENMPSGNAIQPGNVLVSRSGKTVEVLNTDAEGRLILGDLLDFAQDYKPDALIDAATLTGAVLIALGKHCGAVLGNDDALVQSVIESGTAVGEKLWQLPLFDEYFEDMKSEVADMKNIGPNSNGGTIRGAIFLKQFIRKGVSWVHLDIAATAWDMGQIPYYPKKGASGGHVRGLARLAMDF